MAGAKDKDGFSGKSGGGGGRMGDSRRGQGLQSMSRGQCGITCNQDHMALWVVDAKASAMHSVGTCPCKPGNNQNAAVGKVAFQALSIIAAETLPVAR